VVRQAGRAVDDRTQSPHRLPVTSTALLTADGAPDLQHLRFTSGLRLTPVFGIQVGEHRRPGHDIPAFGTPEHSALLTGSFDLNGLEGASRTAPVVGFSPIVLDRGGPTSDDGRRAATRVLPSRRSLRAAGGATARGSVAKGSAGKSSGGKGHPFANGVLPGSGLPGPRGAAMRHRAVSPQTTGGLCVEDVERALAAQKAPISHEPPTGELARPFVDDTVLGAWSAIDDVPPPVSVDVFQRAVRAGLALDDAESLKALDDGSDVAAASRRSSRSARSRRELRARERATTSARSVTARRIAKGGVLAITALGVVSSATPQGLSALGLSKDGSPTRNMVDFSGALAPDVSAPVLTDAQVQQLRQASVTDNLRTELTEVQAADAVRAGVQAGGALAALAKQQDADVLAARQAARQRAVRDVAANPQGYAKMLLAEKGQGAGQFQCLVSLWNKESRWNYRATNPSSGAYGIPQALPGSKMNSVGADWRTNPITQIKWGLNYIEDRYGTPCGAWAHSQKTGWY
jgi:hypothetical protein